MKDKTQTCKHNWSITETQAQRAALMICQTCGALRLISSNHPATQTQRTTKTKK